MMEALLAAPIEHVRYLKEVCEGSGLDGSKQEFCILTILAIGRPWTEAVAEDGENRTRAKVRHFRTSLGLAPLNKHKVPLSIVEEYCIMIDGEEDSRINPTLAEIQKLCEAVLAESEDEKTPNLTLPIETEEVVIGV